MPAKKESKTEKNAISSIKKKAKGKSSLKPIKSWNLTCVENVKVKVGDSTIIEARDYVQALEHALWVAGFSLVKESKKK